MSEIKRVYFNEPQRTNMYINANRSYHVWGRRGGKSVGLIGPTSIDNIINMPRSMGAFVFPTYKMGLSQVLPNTIDAWKFYGYHEDVHFVINKKPMAKWNWQKPFIQPRDYQHTISWFNGSIQVLISQDRYGTSNSYSLDWLMGDEAKFLNYQRLLSETFPALSGSYHSIKAFSEMSCFKSQMFCTDMPVRKTEQWILDKSKDVDKNLIDLILHLYKRYSRTENPQRKKELLKQLNKLRMDALYYSEASALDNIKILGEKYIRDCKRDLPPFEFRTSILNIRPGKVEHGYYDLFSDQHHVRPVSFDNTFFDKFEYNFEEINKVLDCRQDTDIDESLSLIIAEDHNADINSLVTGQAHYEQGELWFLKSMYVKAPLKFSDMLKKWVRYYEPHRHKNNKVVYYYDATSIKRSDLSVDTNMSLTLSILSKAGWSVKGEYLGKQEFHDVRYNKWALSFKGESGLYPSYNKYNCYDLITAMEQTGIAYTGTRGFGKDKRDEHKHFETEEQQPHLTDAMDTLKRGSEERPVHNSMASGVATYYPSN